MTATPSDASRLESLWSSEFGDAYVERNRNASDVRGPFWNGLLDKLALDATTGRVLEVGCNIGANLKHIAARLAPMNVWGLDVNQKSIDELRARVPGVNALTSTARELPFRDAYFDLVFTMAVLIHQPDETLPQVMDDIVRVSRRFVFCAEYFAAERTVVPWRGQDSALFKRDFGGIYAQRFPQLSLVEQGFLSRDTGWDDVTWWLFEKRR